MALVHVRAGDLTVDILTKSWASLQKPGRGAKVIVSCGRSQPEGQATPKVVSVFIHSGLV